MPQGGKGVPLPVGTLCLYVRRHRLSGTTYPRSPSGQAAQSSIVRPITAAAARSFCIPEVIHNVSVTG